MGVGDVFGADVGGGHPGMFLGLRGTQTFHGVNYQ